MTSELQNGNGEMPRLPSRVRQSGNFRWFCTRGDKPLCSAAVWWSWLTAMLLLCAGSPASGDEVSLAGIAFFEKRIRPVLVKHCYACHSAAAKELRGGLFLDTRGGLLMGGDSGPAAVPRRVEASLLIRAVRYQGPKMPPAGKLPDAAIADLEKWVRIGMPDPRAVTRPDAPPSRKIDLETGRQFWAFRQLRSVEPPPVPDEQKAWPRTPIDRFILARRAGLGLRPASRADRRVLLRRASFDLLGLPPTPDAVKAFMENSWEQAYRGLLDQLLESDDYGERWARHWLDIARFAESNGFEKDEDRPTAYHYRDFVIKALNRDLPYDEFVRWQIAGDLLQPDEPLARAATGFLVAGVMNVTQTFKEFERDRYDELDDMVSTLGTAMLGITIGCARCHDHKYDPIQQLDYYRLAASFAQTTGREIPLADQEDAPRAYAALDVGDRVTKSDLKQFNSFGDRDRYFVNAQVHFLDRGDVGHKGQVVAQGFPQVLLRPDNDVSRWTGSGESATSRRVALARWLTDVEHGAGSLLARVIVNRLWYHHLGVGLVATPSDLGIRGGVASHPQLLEWLAAELIRQDWRLKPIHRLIMNSAVYLQRYQSDPASLRTDPQNQWYWRRRLRRLEAEVLRDAMLAASGLLDGTRYGPGTLDEGSQRRSIYFTVKRSRLVSALSQFDAPDGLQGVGRRQTTTVAPQALLLLNSERIRQYAVGFARRIDGSGTVDLAMVIQRGYQYALARPATAGESRQLARFLENQIESYQAAGAEQPRQLAVTDFCQLLFCLNEFAYVE